jgi:hypothetical protein
MFNGGDAILRIGKGTDQEGERKKQQAAFPIVHGFSFHVNSFHRFFRFLLSVALFY